MSSDRRSRTCAAGLVRQRLNLARPRRVAPRMVRAGPASLVVVPLTSASPSL